MGQPWHNTIKPVSESSYPSSHMEWPESASGAGPAIAAGWRATPINEYIFKLVGRCNLACTYCYVYKMADQSWRERPVIMSRATIEQAGFRIAEHALTHNLSGIRVVLHGGEPLLGGPELVDDAASSIREHLGPGIDLDISIQTNGVLLDERFMEVMHSHRIKIGLSLDGAAAQHDRNRSFANGSGSHQLVRSAVRLLNKPEHRGLFAGLLCTIDLNNDPLAVYEELLSCSPPMLDFLLPHGTWATPPPGLGGSGSAPYARWLNMIFDRWYSAVPCETRIRLFEEIIQLLLGGRSKSDQVGLSPAAFLVVDTDGSLQQTDALKAAYAGAPETGLNVFEHAVDEALRHPSVAARQLGLAALADECLRCRVVAVCGGGHYPHRYQAGRGFRNPSVYCSDLRALIDHIASRLITGLSA